MGAYPRGTGSNPVEGNGHFLSSCRQLYLSSFSDTHTPAWVTDFVCLTFSRQAFTKLVDAICDNMAETLAKDRPKTGTFVRPGSRVNLEDDSEKKKCCC